MIHQLKRAAACDGKHPFASKALALEVANRRRHGKGRAPAKVYRCEFCGSYHIGSKS